MSNSPAYHRDIQPLVTAARAGDEAAIGQLLDVYRDYLRDLVRRRIGRQLDRRFDASDMVQQTFLDAHQNFAQFAGSEEPELLAWLRRILRCTMANAIRDHWLTQKRAMTSEQPLEFHAGPRGGDGELAAKSLSPSQKFIRWEESVRLLEAMEQLPDDQRTAVRLRHLAGLSIAEIAAELDRSPTAAAGLVKRGMQGLREILVTEQGESG